MTHSLGIDGTVELSFGDGCDQDARPTHKRAPLEGIAGRP